MDVAVPSGARATAKLYARSGSSAMPVPSAMTPNPSQIQFTSGFTTTCKLADWSFKSKAGSTM